VSEPDRSRVQTLTVAGDEADLRLDRWFRRRFPALGHGRLEKLLRTGQVRVDGKRAKSGLRLTPGQTVRVPPLATASKLPTGPKQSRISEQEAADLQARVLYKDDWLIVLDKPAGLAVQGGSGLGRHLDALSEALRFGAAEKPRLVHRLDKGTSGVLVLARSAAAARALTAAFRGQAARKTYWAAVVGVPERRLGRIDLPLAKGRAGPEAAEKMAAKAGGQPAVTLYRVVQAAGRRAAWLVLRPLTGRTHQLRAHCAAIGHPILGDGKYGGRAAFLPFHDLSKEGVAHRLHLHARELAIPHPADGTTLRVSAPLPGHMAATWARLGFDPTRGDSLPELED
jgi:23S rRNA pseudouridine955/2504/2580 synthase